jgi:hypothetical protein
MARHHRDRVPAPPKLARDAEGDDFRARGEVRQELMNGDDDFHGDRERPSENEHASARRWIASDESRPSGGLGGVAPDHVEPWPVRRCSFRARALTGSMSTALGERVTRTFTVSPCVHRMDGESMAHEVRPAPCEAMRRSARRHARRARLRSSIRRRLPPRCPS